MTEIHRLKRLLGEAAEELAIYVSNAHPYRHVYPDVNIKYKRDMDLVDRIREVLDD